MVDNILLVDKEVGWTSADVVNVLKKKLNPKNSDLSKIKLNQNEKRFRIGHAGTLDPFATGLLLVLVGDATKKFDELQGLKKEYIAEIEFGKDTDTQDVDGKVVAEFEGKMVFSKEKIVEVLKKNFTGKIQQIPPHYSAIKINGKRAYDLARAGKVVEIKPREVEIYEWEILDFSENILKLRLLVSSGTYIRTIANDLGQFLGYGAYCKSLRRTKIGEYSVIDAKKVSEY
jgi:tRNA pseudouridine55 synthase